MRVKTDNDSVVSNFNSAVLPTCKKVEAGSVIKMASQI